MVGVHIVRFMKERHSLPDEWRWSLISSTDLPEDFIKISGAVYEPMKSGKRKGHPNWKKPLPGTEKTDFLRESEVLAWADKRERELGICKQCGGEGRLDARISVEGTQYRDCPRCSSTGTVKEPTP